MENTAQISDAFLVKLVTQLMTHRAAGFLHKKPIRNIARFALHVPGTRSAFRMEWNCIQGSSSLPPTWSPTQLEPDSYSAP